MMDLRVSGETPPGGWWHKEAHSGIRFPEKGFYYDYGQLIAVLLEHRKATGGDLDIGWEERLRHDMCLEHPDYPCMERGNPSERRLTLSDVKNFLYSASSFIESGASFVPQEEADRRAAICERCPLNVPVSGCFGCAGIANAAMDFVAQRKTAKDEALQSCNVCGCFLRVKVWMPEESMSQGQEWPKWCWNYKDA